MAQEGVTPTFDEFVAAGMRKVSQRLHEQARSMDPDEAFAAGYLTMTAYQYIERHTEKGTYEQHS